jgi:phosphate starvation-inducible PhoH-like protein
MSGPAADGSVVYAVSDPAWLREICGPHHTHLALLERALGVRLESQGGGVVMTGDTETLDLTRRAIDRLVEQCRSRTPIDVADVRAAAKLARQSAVAQPGRIILPGRRGVVNARTETQTRYLEALISGPGDLIFGIGPAGTGKTYLAVAAGLFALLEGRVGRLIVTRPAVEAGERLGFLPGDLKEKVDPYLQPIWDSIKALLGSQQLEARRLAGDIEVAPLAFMRGRTLADAFVIVDEAQNATRMQMKMVLTRLGDGARMAVTGDPSQVDLARKADSGLAHALRILDGVEGVATCRFTSQDVVRHPLVGRIVDAYDRDAAREGGHDS